VWGGWWGGGKEKIHYPGLPSKSRARMGEKEKTQRRLSWGGKRGLEKRKKKKNHDKTLGPGNII